MLEIMIQIFILLNVSQEASITIKSAYGTNKLPLQLHFTPNEYLY